MVDGSVVYEANITPAYIDNEHNFGIRESFNHFQIRRPALINGIHEMPRLEAKGVQEAPQVMHLNGIAKEKNPSRTLAIHPSALSSLVQPNTQSPS